MKKDKAYYVAKAIKSAESVLHIYEAYGKSKAPRKAIEAAKAWLANPTEANRKKAGRAAWRADAADADAAAYADDAANAAAADADAAAANAAAADADAAVYVAAAAAYASKRAKRC